MKLLVYVGAVQVGVLSHSDEGYEFTYLESVPPTRAVSLRMPTTQRSWQSRELFPAFQVSMPEGWLLRQVEDALVTSWGQATPMQILEAVGSDMVGDLAFVAEASASKCPANVWEHDSARPSREELSRFTQWPGISGGFPKALRSRSDGSGLWILKCDDEDHLGLSLIEYFGMCVSRAAGLPTPEVRLSEDCKSLWIRRFDVTPSGERLAFEDMCSLLGLPASGKYDGSVERVVRAISDVVAPRQRREACETFYARYLLAAAIRNGDAHLKNFGILFSRGETPKLAPVFDMLTMATYATRRNDGDANDGMALTLRGSRRWPSLDDLSALAGLCDVPVESQREWGRRISRAVKEVEQDVDKTACGIPDRATRYLLARMLDLWRIGARSLSLKENSHK